MSIKNSIQHIIKCSLVNMNLPKEIELKNIMVEKPANKENGDYSTNIALTLTKILKKSPMIIAENIKNILYEWERHISKGLSKKEAEILFSILKKICINQNI